jgi:hypothetical protein
MEEKLGTSRVFWARLEVSGPHELLYDFIGAISIAAAGGTAEEE